MKTIIMNLVLVQFSFLITLKTNCQQTTISQLKDKISFISRPTFSLLQGFGNENNIFYMSQNELTGYGLRAVNGIKYLNSELGLGIGIEKWDSMVFTLFMSYLYGFDASRYMPWLFIKLDGGWAHGEMNPDSPYSEFRSDNAWFIVFGPGAKIRITSKTSLICGVNYEFHKQILKKEFRYNSVESINFIGVYLGLNFLIER
jgi:hypothetical protein